MSLKSAARILHALFEGSDLAHGRSEVTERVSAKGKREARSWTEPRAATIEDWEAHLAGKSGIGIPPIRSDSMVRWGAIDVDLYQGLDLDTFVHELYRQFKFPVVFRSKSGGPHIFVFLKDWVPAIDLIHKLEELAAYMGFGTSEIFPKQVSLSSEGPARDFGNWINMPYFNGVKDLRFAYDDKMQAIQTPEQLRDFIEPRRVTPDQIRVLATPQRGDEAAATGAAGGGPDLFDQGPPCLQRIWSSGVPEMRNIALSNAAVYLKKAFPTNWQEKLDEYNALMAEPLGSGEVETIKKSYAKKDYRYSCSKEPLCRFCFARVCRERIYGVGGDGLLANNRSLSKWNSEPPIWFLDVELPDGKRRRMALSTDQLQRFTLFQKRAMEVLNQCPNTVKQEFWINTVQSLMRHVNIIDVPFETTVTGQLLEHLEEFLRNRAKSEDWENILRKIPYRDLSGFYFRFKDFTDYLATLRFNGLTSSQIGAILRDNLGGQSVQRRIAGRNLRLWHIPPDFITEESTELKVRVPPTEDGGHF